MKKFFDKLKKNKKYLVLFIVLIALICIPLVYTISKYVINTVTEHYYNSKDFFFYSDVLDGSTYDLYSYDGSSDYSFTVDLKNYKDELNFTDSDTTYDLSVTCKNGGTTVECNTSGESTIVGNNLNSNTDTIKLVKGSNTFNNGDVIDVTVKATSASPYKKELTGNFKIHVNSIGLSYYVLDNENKYYLEFVISNNGDSKDVSLSFDPTLINIDNNNYYVINGSTTSTTVDSVSMINKLTFNASKGNVYSIRFYKNDITQNYTYSDLITVE